MTLASNTARMAGLSDSPLYGQNSLDFALSRAWPGAFASRFKQGQIGLDLGAALAGLIFAGADQIGPPAAVDG